MDKDELYIRHILDAINTIESYVASFQREDFVQTKNKLTQDGVIRELEIIGEATGKLSEAIKKANPILPWREIAAMRNKLIHEYFGVDLGVVWQTVQEDLPKLKTTLKTLAQAA